MTYQSYPLSWPVSWARTNYRRGSDFGRHSIAECVDEITRQLKLLGATDIVISTNLRVRQDGLPYSNQAQPSDVGVGRDAVETALLRSGKDKSVAALRREAFSPTALDASLEFYRVSGFKVLNAKSRLAGGQQLYEACDGDLSLIEKAFNDLRKSGARITDEYSLVATCNVMASERKRQPAVPVDPDPYVGWEPQPDGSMRRVRASEVKA